MSLSNILVPSAGCLLGVYPGSSCDSATSDLARLRNHETLVNRTATTNGILNIATAYHDFDDFTSSFAAPSGGEGTMSSEGRILLIHWTPRIFGGTTQFRWPDIAAGTYDASYVDPTARAMRDYGKKFFLAFHNEMNASSSASGGTYGTDAEYAAAAQHIHDRFLAQGATNVVWVFKPSGYTTTISRMSTLYPGDAYVDWIGYDPYVSGGQDATYMIDTKYPMYTWATVTKSGSHTKPLMWAEWGGTEASGPTTKAQFIEQVRTLLPANYPLIKAICWFNSTGGPGDCLNTSAAALNAYKILAADPYFNPDLAATPPPPPGTGAFSVSTSKAFSNSANQTITVPATAQAGMGMALFHGCSRTGLRNAGEGTNLGNVTTGNSNSSGSNPWDSVGSPIPVYSSTQAHTGTTSIHHTVTAQTTSRTTWQAAFGSPSTYYGRLYYFRTALPTQITRLMQQNPTTGSNWGIGLDTAGKVIIRDLTAGATRYTSTITPAANVWNRLEWKAVWNGSTTTVDVRIYENTNAGGAAETTLDDSGSSTAFTMANAGISYNFGLASSIAQTYDLYLDDMGLDTNTWMGPAPQTSAVLTPPDGWTEIVPTGTRQVAAGAGDLSTRGFRRTVAAGDPGSNVTLNTDVNCHGGIELVVYSGVDPLALVDVAAASTKNADSATVVTPNVTTTGAGEWVLSVGFTRDNPGGLTTSWSLPTGPPVEVQRAASFPTGTADGRVAGVVSDDAVAHAAGTFGTKTLTSTVTSFLGVGWTVALLPAATGGGETQSCGLVGIP